ncbi:prepilin peptidase [Lentibacillus cibarius]|uniref:Prepilin type IV endopeptidase peptidase domain-containing protein n=1 Tax=Lentibacillus cibarius TaxID=2583219 RepID=A0A5S3R807_9BACI|nr:prepilin peptidase [Lentibacillus cibarius]TMN23273.1 hypothetical protein FFL34_15140 [Lentibacillus cibarius]
MLGTAKLVADDMVVELTVAFLMAAMTVLLIKSMLPFYTVTHLRTKHIFMTRSFLVLIITYFFITRATGLTSVTYDQLIVLLLIVLVITAAVMDAAYMVIPDRLLVVFALPILLTQIFNHTWLVGLGGGLFAFILLLLLAVLYKGGIGGGDIKLVTVIGLGTSLEFVYWLLIFSCLLAFFFGILSIFLGYRDKNEMVPFGPAIALVAISMLLYN